MADPIRIEITAEDDPDFAGAWAEFSPAWTRGEERIFWHGAQEEAWAVILSKIIACHLPTADGGALTGAADLSEENLDRVDQRLLLWLGGASVAALMRAKKLGEALRRSLFSRQEEGKADARTKPLETPTS